MGHPVYMCIVTVSSQIAVLYKILSCFWSHFIIILILCKSVNKNAIFIINTVFSSPPSHLLCGIIRFVFVSHSLAVVVILYPRSRHNYRRNPPYREGKLVPIGQWLPNSGLWLVHLRTQWPWRVWEPETGAGLRGLWVTIGGCGVMFSDNSPGVEAGCVRGVGVTNCRVATPFIQWYSAITTLRCENDSRPRK